MKGREGYYSLIQYCPDRFRAETANVGVLVFVPGERTLRAKVTAHGRHAKQMFHLNGPETMRVCKAANAIADRIERSSGEMLTIDDLQRFIDTRANDIRITDARLAKIDDLDVEVNRLFEDLVEREQPETTSAAVLQEESLLSNTFDRLIQQRRAFRPEEVVVPIRRKMLKVPYAYQNSTLNLVKPERFSRRIEKAVDEAALLAIDGDLLHANPEAGVPRQLVVVSAGAPTHNRLETEERLTAIFERYHVRFVPGDQVEAFAAEVEASAH